MRLSPLTPIIEKSLEMMFVVDKHGDTLFFPWGSRHKGYVLNDLALQEKISKFYSVSFTIYLFTMCLLFAIFFRSGWFIGIIFIWAACFLFIYSLYINRITKSLSSANASYVDILLDKIVPDEEEAENQELSYIPRPATAAYPGSEPVKGPFVKLGALFYRLPSGLWCSILWLIGMAIAVIWYTFHPAYYSNSRANELTAFFALFFGGLGFLTYVIKGDSIRGNSPPWFPAICGLGLSLLFLYGFIVGK
jgi:hypothetical protein